MNVDENDPRYILFEIEANEMIERGVALVTPLNRAILGDNRDRWEGAEHVALIVKKLLLKFSNEMLAANSDEREDQVISTFLMSLSATVESITDYLPQEAQQ